MKNYKDVKDEVLGCSSFLVGFVATLIWSANTCYWGLTENEGWLVFAIEAAICFSIATLSFFAIHWIALKIDRYSTKRFIISVLKKFTKWSETAFSSSLDGE